MTDPIVLNGPMPSEEYLRYAAFWTSTFKACFVFVAGIMLVVLVSLSLMAARVVAEVQKMRHAIERQTDLRPGARAAAMRSDE